MVVYLSACAMGGGSSGPSSGSGGGEAVREGCGSGCGLNNRTCSPGPRWALHASHHCEPRDRSWRPIAHGHHRRNSMKEGGGGGGRIKNSLCFWRTLVLVLVSCLFLQPTGADGNVGCLFSESLCEENVEWCYDDNAFGKCLQVYGNVEEDDLFRYDLTTEELRAFEQELQRLLLLGYRWSHAYTQCVLQGMLYAIQNNLHYDSAVCDHLVDQDLTAALGAFETDDEADPQSVAVVRFTPNNQQAIERDDFADEVYIPPEQLLQAEDPTYEELNKLFNRKRSQNNVPSSRFSRIYNTPGEFRNGHETKDLLSSFNILPLVNDNFYNGFDPEKLEDLLQLYNQDAEEISDKPDFPENWLEDLEIPVKSSYTGNFHQNYNTPDTFRQGYESRDNEFGMDDDKVPTENVYPEPKNVDYENIEMLNDYPANGENNQWNYFNPPTAYTEGGLVSTGDSSDREKHLEVLKSLFTVPEWADYFPRMERLDVKKPGPLFDKHINHKKDGHDSGRPIQTATPLSGKFNPTKDHVENPHVDDSYSYIAIKDSIHTWKEGPDTLKEIARLLNLDPSMFRYIRVDRNEITFRVEDKNNKLNASEVASRIYAIKDKIKKELGLEITSTGVGDKAKHPIVKQPMSFEDEQWYHSMLLAACTASVAAAAGVVSAVLYVRYRRRRAHKLNQLPHDTEASEDYQQLCRARMQSDWTKGSSEKGTRDGSSNRIASLSKDSDNNSPSTRSSTSSWSEEPALTNMDISTGHMVLTYMEDHLKNKDRLEQEWKALCAYEAEPSATTMALQEDNADKNRAPGVLPYDHSRLVLSNISNQHNSDYINASTITDHDPRNPAYIAAQGPLEHTAADFWQMVWEQGSVVMVMLTRLNEGGVSMCHRYWPEEGADLYHIYEVHLVSEHIWCDDYLVRSFYLKNVKSGETRTVTQFHFLSWPDRGVPSSTKALLEFRRKVNKSYRGRSCPIVVHCSDGAGRTGTYCLIDMVLNRMAKGAKEIDIAATLEHIRDQRPHMVSTKQQFEFVLMAVAEEVHAILKALPAQIQQQQEKKEKELAAEKEKTEKEK